ncbi:filamentous hemagglutinin N-terminal domain-containing protein, partial [Microbacteriaceae bacterium K1510]|nr:filamentous hemagglutinin N-terminal domain-containing protein [Microbacteriaceae bacterium K1510]
MLTCSLAVSPSRNRSALSRGLLLATVSAAALFVADPVHARPLGSFTAAPSAAALAASQSSSQEAAQAARQATNALKRATQAIQSMQATQAAARDAARAQLNAIATVPNGLQTGGLQVAPGAAVGSALWQGAKLPTQSANGDRTNVTVEQTQAQAILTWQTFNVGAKTDLAFDQKGNRSWVALNRVLDNTAPSRILGTIKADGSVYVVNQNGIIFGGSAQVNVGALIASTANITNDQFLSKGIYSSQTGTVYVPSFTGATGKITVEAGALIATHAPAQVTSGGGFVALLGTSVTNEGTITTPKGQALLAAGDDFILRPGYGTDANTYSTTRGNEV